LWIGKQCSDSANNNIGEKGAAVIADRMKSLKELNVGKQQSDSANNNIGENGAVILADRLNGL
jgi:hypothetical protein